MRMANSGIPVARGGRWGAIRRGPRSSVARRCTGAVTLELILALPIWLIALLAIIEFGQILSGLQQVALASRVGAEEASQTSALATFGTVPPNVLTAINQQLASSGMSQCRVIVEHNVGGSTILSTGTCDNCLPPVNPEFPPSREYVRVTVCVPMTELSPNLLGLFGFDISDCLAQQSTTFRYEMTTP